MPARFNPIAVSMVPVLALSLTTLLTRPSSSTRPSLATSEDHDPAMQLAGTSTPTPPPIPPTSAVPITFIAPVFWSWGPVISADGRYIAFGSAPANRDPGDEDWLIDLFYHDRLTGETSRITPPGGAHRQGETSEPDWVSRDGRFLIFSSARNTWVSDDSNRESDVFLLDRLTGLTQLVSRSSDERLGNQGSENGSLSADGRYLTFTSSATNFVGPDLNLDSDAFLRDLETGYTTLVSRASDGTPSDGGSADSTISADGCCVVFSSASTNLVGGDTNAASDVFLHDRTTGEVMRVSVASDGAQGNGPSRVDSISADGRYIVFTSRAEDLVPGDANRKRDIFLHDRATGRTTRVSAASDGSPSGGGARWGSISGDGRYVAFESDASDLVPGDTNAVPDTFLLDRWTGEMSRISMDADGGQESIGAGWPMISENGRYVAFNSAEFGGVVVYDRTPEEPAPWLATPTSPPAPLETPTPTPPAATPSMQESTTAPEPVAEKTGAEPSDAGLAGRLCGSATLAVLLGGYSFLKLRQWV